MDRTGEIYAWLTCKFATVISKTEVCRVDDIFLYYMSRKATKGGRRVIARRIAKGRYRITA